MKILCTICARGNSQGLKNKNIKKINGKPLIWYTIEHAKKSNIFNEILVSSDSKKILEISKTCGIKNILRRPRKFSSNKAGKLDAIKHALLELEKIKNKKFDVIVDLDVTSHLRKVSDILDALKLFKKKNATVVTSGSVSKKSPYFNQVIKRPNSSIELVKKKNLFLRRQDVPLTFDLNASIYVYSRNHILRSNSIFSRKTYLYLMPENRSVDIDNLDDFKYVEYLLKLKKKNIY